MKIRRIKILRNKQNYLNNNLLLFLLIITVFLLRIYNIHLPLLDLHPFRQTQTAATARNFYLNGINLFQTELDVFGIGKERFQTLEFPLYQAIVTVLYKIFFINEIWGRLVSIFFGLIAGIYIYRLIKLVFHDRLWALLSAFFFLFAPLNIWYQRTFMIESCVIGLLLTGLYYYCDWIIRPTKRNFVLCVILLTLGFLQKGMYGPFWLIPMVIFFMNKYPLHRIIALRPLFVLFMPLFVLFLWQRHVNIINDFNGHGFFTTYNQGQLEWNFGNLSDRLSVSMWSVRFKQILDGILLKPGVIVFLVGLFSIRLLKNRKFLYSWLISQFIYLFIFFRIQSHNYYQMIMIPVVAIIMAFGLLTLAHNILILTRRFFPEIKGRLIQTAFIVCFCLMFGIISWRNSSSALAVDWSLYHRLIMLKNVIPKGTYGILITPSYDWNSIYSYYSERKILMAGFADLTEENIQKWLKLGYSFIILQNYKDYPDILMKDRQNQISWLNEKNQLVLELEDMKVYLLICKNYSLCNRR